MIAEGPGLRVPIVVIALVPFGFGCSRKEEPLDRATEGRAPPASSSEAPVEPASASLPLPGDRRDVSDAVAGALRAVAADLDGDGRAELVLVDAEAIRVVNHRGVELSRASVHGGIQVLTAVDLDGDRRDEVAAGWGMTREHREATARVTLHHLAGEQLVEEVVIAPATSRHDVQAIVPVGPGALLIAYFESKYMVKSVRAVRRGRSWGLEDVASLRMATSYAFGDADADRRPDVVVGRVYGDDREADGDAFLLAPGGDRVPIPTTRGVRGLALADVDGDGQAEIYLGDGWHRNYGRLARGRLTWARWEAGRFRSDLIEETPGQYTIWHIVPADVDGDGRPEIVTRGSHHVRVHRWHDGRWHGLTVGGESRDVAVGKLDDHPGDDLLILGPRSEVVSLGLVRWHGGAPNLDVSEPSPLPQGR
jgi:hypothetical protein